MSDLRPDEAFLSDMLEHAKLAVTTCAGLTEEDLFPLSMARMALERTIEIIGEAARRLSPEMHAAHPEIPWRKIITTRHILAHDYFKTNPEILWRIVTVHLPELIRQLEPLVPPPPVSPE